jgi:membrane protease subunit (stomatin/prohibitin family)
MSIETEGDYSIHARDTVTVNESFTDSSDKWFVQDITHSLGETYVTRLNLVK